MCIRDSSEDELAPDRPSVEDTEGLLKFIANHDYQLLGRPGQYVSYSNDAYGLLGSIIELVSGKSYEDYLQENILMPLGMAHTTTRVDRIKELPDVTSLYYKDKDDNLCTSEHWQEAPSFTACGFIKSTVRDLLSYLNLYLNNGTVGAVSYTHLQRKGLGISSPYPLYVVGIDVDENKVIAGERSEAYAEGCYIEDVNFIMADYPDSPVEGTCMVRYRGREVPATLIPCNGGPYQGLSGRGRALVRFSRPQFAVTPGQALVFYQGEFVYGGGTIAEKA